MNWKKLNEINPLIYAVNMYVLGEVRTFRIAVQGGMAPAAIGPALEGLEVQYPQGVVLSVTLETSSPIKI